mgnify:CR=1 FL=1
MSNANTYQDEPEKVIAIKVPVNVVGNKEEISIREWVELCYKAVGKIPEFVNVYKDIEQRYELDS